MYGLNFALCSGKEHHQLRFSYSINLKTEHLVYREDISKNRLGGPVEGEKNEAKVVYYHENLDDPNRCFVRLYKLYINLCLVDGTTDSFYLMPLQDASATCWYSIQLLGYQKLGTTVTSLRKWAGILGYRTNHSLRVTAATRLYDSGFDEQLVLETTGHCSMEEK